MKIETDLVWNQLGPGEKQLVASSFGQWHVGDLIYEGHITDERFQEEGDLPWDAVGSVTEHGQLALEGMTEPSGGGHYMAIRLPMDVKMSVNVWRHEKPEAPDLEKVQKYMRAGIDEIREQYKSSLSPTSRQETIMDLGVCEVLSEISETILRLCDSGEHDFDSCLGAMIALSYVVSSIRDHDWGDLIENFTVV